VECFLIYILFCFVFYLSRCRPLVLDYCEKLNLINSYGKIPAELMRKEIVPYAERYPTWKEEPYKPLAEDN
jgi:hypothetical protein